MTFENVHRLLRGRQKVFNGFVKHFQQKKQAQGKGYRRVAHIARVTKVSGHKFSDRKQLKILTFKKYFKDY